MTAKKTATTRPVEPQRRMTPPQLARLLAVTPETVIGWIRAGELRAIDVSSRGSRRPRYRISPEDLAAFEAGREVQAPAKVTRTGKMKDKPDGWVEYF
jgi:excisionase family DNA binding protein